MTDITPRVIALDPQGAGYRACAAYKPLYG